MRIEGRKPVFSSPFLWIFGYLCAIDISINLLFPYPTDPRNITPSRLQQFFEYGRSTEGKYARMTRPTNDASAAIVASGWLESDTEFFLTDTMHRANKPIVTIYGMSHAGDLARALSEVDTLIAVRYVGAPGAVVSWAFAAYSIDTNRVHSAIAVLAVMTDGIPFITTTSGEAMSWWFPYPYTYPRYYISAGELLEVRPPFMSVSGYREYFYDQQKWSQYRMWLQCNDRYYDPLLFQMNILDKSSLCRLLRRSYASITRRSKEAYVFDGQVFNTASEDVKLLRALVSEFARSARASATIPVVYIVNSMKTDNSLYALLAPLLSTESIAFLNSETVCASEDPEYFTSDGHFTTSANMRLATAMERVIQEQLGEGKRRN